MAGESLYKARTRDCLLSLAGAVVMVVAALAALAALALVMARALRSRDGRDHGADQVAEFVRVQADTAARIEAMRDMLASRQADLARMVNERLDSVTHHLSQAMHTTRQHTAVSLQKLNDRLVAIDRAQKDITQLAP